MSNVGLQMRPKKEAPRGPVRRSKSLVAVLLSLSVVGVIGYVLYLGLSQFDGFSTGAKDFVGEGTGQVEITVKPGQTLAQIGQTMKAAGVVASVEAWLDEAKTEPKTKSIGPGSYAMAEKMSAAAAVARMVDPKSRITNKLLLREGLRIWESLEQIHKVTDIPLKKLEKASEDAKAIGLPKYAKGNPEGFIFPATYEVEKGETAESILSKTVSQYQNVTDEINLAAGAKKQGISSYEALIIASLIQAEGRAEDFAKISRVIHNRLDPKTWGGTYGLLQLDAALNYALKNKDVILTNDQVQNTDSPYNLYKNVGLPPTPINSPGKAALEAAIKPAKGDWLYYVTVNTDTGETKFTNDYDEFLKFKKELSKFLESK